MISNILPGLLFRLKIKYLPSWATYLLILAIWPIYPLLFMICLLVEYFIFN